MYIQRKLDIRSKLQSKSHFLLGPRQTGKSTLIRNELGDARVYNLLDSRLFLDLSRNPSLIREELTPEDSLIVIDEIQKLPELLQEVHLLIEEHDIRFLLTGSSARKLRRGGVNLLGGRARELTLRPFISRELGDDFDLDRALNYGLIPSMYLSSEPELDLKAYVGMYLSQEVASEGLARNVPAFGRFLEVAAHSNATVLNHSKVSIDAQVPRSTVQEYFGILEDTLVANTVPSWTKGSRRKPLATSKFYFFDPGVVRVLRNQGDIRPGSPGFGEAFETFIHHELQAYVGYLSGPPISYWRTRNHIEVDFLLGDATAIEVKGKRTVSGHDLKGLKAIADEGPFKHRVLVSLIDRARTVDGIRILPWTVFLDELWNGAFG